MAKDFKKKYPRQYEKLMKFYGKENKIFDKTAAVQMYLRGEGIPKCDVCGVILTITKFFRSKRDHLRCKNHINTDDVITKSQIMLAETKTVKVVSIPDRFLTRTTLIRVKCTIHEEYNIKIGSFLDGMRCQKCYLASKIGKPGVIHSVETRKKISTSKIGKTVSFTAESRAAKILNQKLAWARRKQDKEHYASYLALLSSIRKQYLKEHNYVFPKGKNTKLEIDFQKFLEAHNINFIKQYLLGGKKFDFYLYDMLLLVEVDGEYWHKFESSIKNDIKKHKICAEHGIQLLRISSDDFRPELIFETKEVQDEVTRQILVKRGIDGF